MLTREMNWRSLNLKVQEWATCLNKIWHMIRTKTQKIRNPSKRKQVLKILKETAESKKTWAIITCHN